MMATVITPSSGGLRLLAAGDAPLERGYSGVLAAARPAATVRS
jgi:hypothetical protein